MKKTDEEVAKMPPAKRSKLIWQRKNAIRLHEYQKQYKKNNLERVASWKYSSKSCQLPLTNEEWTARGIISEKIDNKLRYIRDIKANPEKLIEASKAYMHKYYTDPVFKINARIRLKKWRAKQK